MNVFAQTISGAENAYVFPPLFTRWSTSEIFAGIRALLHYRRSQALPSPVLADYPDLSQPRQFTTGKQKGFGNSPLSFTECKFCYSSTSLGPFRLQSSKWKIDIFLSFSLSPDDPEFGDRPSHVHNMLISTMTLNFCQRCGFRKDPVVVDNTRDLLRIDIKDIEDRISELKKIRSNKPYEKQKSSTHRELVRFLASLPTPQVSLLCLSLGHLKIPCLEGQVRPGKSLSDVMSTSEPNSILLL